MTKTKTDAADIMGNVLQTALTRCFQLWNGAELWERKPEHRTVYGSSLCHDGRRRPAVVRKLVEEYRVIEPVEGVEREEYRIVRGLAESAHVKPVFAITDEEIKQRLERRHEVVPYGVRFSDLSAYEQAYVLAHRDDYRLVWIHNYGSQWCPVTKADPRALERFTPKGARHALGYTEGAVYVTDDQLAARFARIARELTVARLIAGNPTWGLVKVLGLREDEAKRVVSACHVSVFATGDAMADPAKWGTDVSEAIERTKRQLAALQEQLVVLQMTARLVVARGGWDKVAEAYVAAIEDAVD